MANIYSFWIYRGPLWHANGRNAVVGGRTNGPCGVPFSSQSVVPFAFAPDAVARWLAIASQTEPWTQRRPAEIVLGATVDPTRRPCSDNCDRHGASSGRSEYAHGEIRSDLAGALFGADRGNDGTNGLYRSLTPYTVSIDERLYHPRHHRERALPNHPFVSYLPPQANNARRQAPMARPTQVVRERQIRMMLGRRGTPTALPQLRFESSRRATRPILASRVPAGGGHCLDTSAVV